MNKSTEDTTKGEENQTNDQEQQPAEEVVPSWRMPVNQPEPTPPPVDIGWSIQKRMIVLSLLGLASIGLLWFLNFVQEKLGDPVVNPYEGFDNPWKNQW